MPTLRSHLGHYFTNTTAEATEEESLRLNMSKLTISNLIPTRSIAYTSEIVGAVLGAALGLMANLLLVGFYHFLQVVSLYLFHFDRCGVC